jgi:hypothetical protein
MPGSESREDARKELAAFRGLAKEASDETNRIAFEGAVQGSKKDTVKNESNALKAAAFRLVKPTVRPYPLDHQYLIKRLRQSVAHFNPSNDELEECIESLVFEKQLERCVVEDTVSNGIAGSESSTKFYARAFFPWDHFKKYNAKTVQLEARAMREEDVLMEAQRLQEAEDQLRKEAEDARLAAEKAIQDEIDRKQRVQERKDKLERRLAEEAAAEKHAKAEAAAQRKIDELKATQELLAEAMA